MTAIKLIISIILHPHYRVLLCARTCLPPSPWADKFDVEIDKKHKVIRLIGDLT